MCSITPETAMLMFVFYCTMLGDDGNLLRNHFQQETPHPTSAFYRLQFTEKDRRIIRLYRKYHGKDNNVLVAIDQYDLSKEYFISLTLFHYRYSYRWHITNDVSYEPFIWQLYRINPLGIIMLSEAFVSLCLIKVIRRILIVSLTIIESTEALGLNKSVTCFN